jgi:hypothetical protein
MERYIIVDKECGIFLGNYLDSPLFSNTLLFPIVKAYSFDSLEDAEYFKNYINDKAHTMTVEPINYNKKYVPIDILIKEGYSKHTERMLKYMEPASEKLH